MVDISLHMLLDKEYTLPGMRLQKYAQRNIHKANHKTEKR